MKGEKTGGRQPGSQNKTTRLVKETMAKVFCDLQDDPENNLKAWAGKYPTEFYKLASKLIPVQIGSDPENPMPTWIETLTHEQLMQLKYGPKAQESKE